MDTTFGVKVVAENEDLLFKSLDLIDNGIFGYIELLVTPDFTFTEELIDKLSNVKLILHAPHENYGVDIGRAEKKDFTIKSIKRSLKLQEQLGADYVIIHCGTGDLEVARENLNMFKEYSDLILLENMPYFGINWEICLGYDAESLKNLNINDFGLCFDFGHAIKASLSIRRNYKELISEFMDFNPNIFHISDGKLDNEIDEHLNIGEGQYDFGFIKEMTKKSDKKYFTLETPRHDNTLEEDIRNLMKLKEFLDEVVK